MDNLGDYIYTFSIHLALTYSFFKICNYKNFSILKITSTFFLIACIVAFQVNINIPVAFKIISIGTIYSLLYGKLSNVAFEKSVVITLISFTISLITAIISSSLFLSVIFTHILNFSYTSILFFIINLIIHNSLVFLLFKIKRFKNGFPFLANNNENLYLKSFILIITAISIFTYFLIAGFTNIQIQHLFYSFILFGIIMIVIIQKNFILFQKQKLQKIALKDYERELSETKQKLSTALSEKQQLVKSNHEFYHRQEALNKKLDDLINQSKTTMNTEFAQEYSDILDRINNLSTEYTNKTQSIPKLPISNIDEIDDMLSYMQSECIKNNIDFIVKIDYDIDNIIEKYITKSQLETLLGDLIRNAIIAINHSSNDFRSIMVVFGIKDNTYELCIYDSGIPFEIKTLLNLGLRPASTHENEGGTGIGFVTTFETLESCKSSLVINELSDNNYTKYLEIKFDGKKEYIIISDRSNEISKRNESNRNIILK